MIPGPVQGRKQTNKQKPTNKNQQTKPKMSAYNIFLCQDNKQTYMEKGTSGVASKSVMTEMDYNLLNKIQSMNAY